MRYPTLATARDGPHPIYIVDITAAAATRGIQPWLLTYLAKAFARQRIGLDQVGGKAGNKSGAVPGTRRQSSAATEPDDPAPPQGARKQSVGSEAAGGVLKAVSESPSAGQGRLVEDKEDVSRGDEVSDKNVGESEEPDDQALDMSARPIHHRQRSDDSRSSAEHVDSGARGDTSSATSSSSRRRAPPDENEALREGRAAQVLSVGGDREPSRGVDTTLPASDEKEAHPSHTAEEVTDAEAKGVAKHEGKGTQDASMSPDTPIKSQREGNESAGGVSRVWTTADHSASEPRDAIATATEGKGAQESGQIVRQTTDLEMSGSVEGSEHSRWSLPSAGGIGGVGGVREERAVWAGLADAEDSMGSAEQAPSSDTGERGGDGKSPRSRVESYDLQQEEVSPDVRLRFVFEETYSRARLVQETGHKSWESTNMLRWPVSVRFSLF